MRRLQHCLIALLVFTVLGCLARRPAPVTIGVAIGPAVAPPAAASAPSTAGIGTLELTIRWPEEPSPGFHTATIPLTTRAIAVFVNKSGTLWAGPERFTREAGTGTTVATRLRIHEGDNLSVDVRAYRDAAPADLDQEILARGAVTVNIRAAQTTTKTVSLVPSFVPSIYSFEPGIAPIGDVIKIVGANLDAVEGTQPRVTFGGVAATTVTSLGSYGLRVTVPSGARTGPVVVMSDGLSSAADEDIFWVPTSLALSAASSSWDPSTGDRRIVIVGTSLALLPLPGFSVNTSALGPWPRTVQYSVGNAGAGSVAAGSHDFQASSALATTSVSAAIGSLASSNALTVSVEDVVTAYMEPDFAILSPGGTSSVSMRSVEILTGGATISRTDLVSSDPDRVWVAPSPAPSATPAPYLAGTAVVSSWLTTDGFVLISAREPIVATKKSTASIATFAPAGVVSTLAGSGTGGFADGAGAQAQFYNPGGVAVDGAGNLYVADGTNHRIRKVSPAGVVSTLAGSGTGGFADGAGAQAQFYYPGGVAVDGAGNVYVADGSNHRIRKVTAAGVVSTLAGSGSGGFADGAGAQAQFYDPTGVAVDGAGTVYVADRDNNRIRKVTAAGAVSTLAGSGTAGFADGAGALAKFTFPVDVAVDKAGSIFVADGACGRFDYGNWDNFRIRKVTASGVVSTLAGSGIWGLTDGMGTQARFAFPLGVAVDSAGNVLVADSENNRIRKVGADGVVSTLAGSGCGYDCGGFADGVGAQARFNIPSGVAVDGAGNIYVSDQYNHRIRKVFGDGVSRPVVGLFGGTVLLEVR